MPRHPSGQGYCFLYFLSFCFFFLLFSRSNKNEEKYSTYIDIGFDFHTIYSPNLFHRSIEISIISNRKIRRDLIVDLYRDLMRNFLTLSDTYVKKKKKGLEIKFYLNDKKLQYFDISISIQVDISFLLFYFISFCSIYTDVS